MFARSPCGWLSILASFRLLLSLMGAESVDFADLQEQAEAADAQFTVGEMCLQGDGVAEGQYNPGRCIIKAKGCRKTVLRPASSLRSAETGIYNTLRRSRDRPNIMAPALTIISGGQTDANRAA